MSCTKRAVFESTLPTLSSVKLLATSVLSNFICDACTGDDLSVRSHREITDHVETLHRYSLSNPSTNIVIAPPLPRLVPDWFQAYLPGFASFLCHEVTRMCNPQLKFLSPFVAPPSYFESDGIHLNSDAGVTFVRFLVSGCDQLFPPDSGTAVPAPPSDVSVAASLTSLSRSIDDLRSDVRRRRLQDNLLFARIKEDRDHEINKSREDRCTISGLVVRAPPPQGARERKEFFKDLISKLIEEACPEPDGRPVVLDVLVNMRFGRGPPYFEVKLDSPASSLKFRTAAAKLAKDDTGSFANLFISNTVNLSTRIRIDILKLIAKRLTTTSEVAYVQGFSSRPTLHYRMKEVAPIPTAADEPTAVVATPGTGRSYTFTESVERWGHLLSTGCLEPVRRKAVQAYSGCLEQYFVVLSDQAPSDSDDSFIDRLTAPTRGRGQGSSRPPRGFRFPGRRGPSRSFMSGGTTRPQQSEPSIPAVASAPPVTVEPSSLKRVLPSDARNSDAGTPTKKRFEDA